MKYQLLFIVLFIPFLGFSQTNKTYKPDYKKIKKEILKQDSPFYYSLLFKKYENGDTTLTTEEKRHLYYGFAFQDNYSPYDSSDYTDSINTILKNNTLTKSDYQNIIRYTEFIFLKNPYNLQALNYALFACDKTDQINLFNKRVAQMNIIFDAVLSSGDGLTKKTAYYVTYINHEYAVLNILGFEFAGEQRLIEHYDFLKVGKNKYNIEGFYFDISPSLNHLNKMFK